MEQCRKTHLVGISTHKTAIEIVLKYQESSGVKREIEIIDCEIRVESLVPKDTNVQDHL